MKNKLSKAHIAIIGIVILLIGGIAFFYNSDFFLHSDLNPKLDFEHYPKDYVELFANSNRENLKLDYTIYTNHKSPITEFYYNDNKYFIQIFKISTKQNLEFKERIVLNHSESKQSDFVHYHGFFDGLYPVFYRANAEPSTHIYLNYQGDAFTTIAQNDTLSCYYLKMKNFSVKYDDKDTSAIFAKNSRYQKKDRLPLLPINIMFIQKNKSIYFLIMSVNNINTTMKPDMLYSLISGK